MLKHLDMLKHLTEQVNCVLDRLVHREKIAIRGEKDKNYLSKSMYINYVYVSKNKTKLSSNLANSGTQSEFCHVLQLPSVKSFFPFLPPSSLFFFFFSFLTFIYGLKSVMDLKPCDQFDVGFYSLSLFYQIRYPGSLKYLILFHQVIYFMY